MAKKKAARPRKGSAKPAPDHEVVRLLKSIELEVMNLVEQGETITDFIAEVQEERATAALRRAREKRSN